jgi:general stress protein 26
MGGFTPLGKRRAARIGDGWLGSTMTPDEVQRFLAASHRWLQISTNGRDGWPHLATMGFVMLDGLIHFTGYRRSQKIVNLLRDPRITVLVEEGEQYDRLRGVAIRGTAEIIDDPVLTNRVKGTNQLKFFGGESAPEDATVSKRVTVRIHPRDCYSWDHAKLGGVH